MVVVVVRFTYSGNSQELGGCSLTLFFILSAVLLNLFIVVLCDLLISPSIDVGIGSDSSLYFGIVVVICPFL